MYCILEASDGRFWIGTGNGICILNTGTGEPDGTTYFYIIHFYRQTFQNLDMGYGSAIAWLLYIIAISITAILFATANRWVYYAGGQR